MYAFYMAGIRTASALWWMATMLLWSMLANPARAENTALIQAEQAKEDLEYEKVLPLLEQAKQQSSTADELVRIHELAAEMHVTYSRFEEAENAFIQLLQEKPDYTLPERSSPKITTAFEAALLIFQEQQAAASETADAGVKTIVANQADVDGGRGSGEPDHQPGDSGLLNKWWFWTAAGGGTVAVLTGGLIAAIYAGTHPAKPATDYEAPL